MIGSPCQSDKKHDETQPGHTEKKSGGPCRPGHPMSSSIAAERRYSAASTAFGLSWNWAASVECAIAVVDDLPPVIVMATASK